MEKLCYNCVNWNGNRSEKEDGEGLCNFLGVNTLGGGRCHGCKTADMSDAELRHNIEEAERDRERLLKLGEAHSHVVPTKQVQQVRKPRKRVAESVIVRYDSNRPHLVPFGHQKEAIERYKDKDEIALFFEMGCGKSFTTLAICEEMYKAGRIKGLLVVAPNDVHRQWYDELVNGVDKNHDGVLWQEMTIDFQAQCVGGRGGQKELYPFERDDMFKFVSVNVDTFSQPHKWEDIVFWANNSNYAIAIDEATSIKNPDSQRSKRLLYEFNNVTRRGKTVVASSKKHPVRFVLTGTPVTNGPMDLWAIMEFVKPNYFGRNYYSFKAYYGMFTKLSVTTSYGSQRDVQVLLTENTWKGIHDCSEYMEAACIFGCSEDTYLTIKHQEHFIGPYKHADELKRLLEPVAMFKKLTDCVDMPTVHYTIRRVEMSDAQKAVYNSMKKDLLAQYNEYTATASNKLVVNLRLSQISSGFIMAKKAADELEYDLSVFGTDLTIDQLEQKDLNPNEVVWLGESNPKLDALMRDVAESNKPLLILTRYSAEAAKIFELCQKAGYRTGLFTGWRVVGGVEAFKAGELDVLVANTRKIAKGHNLQIAYNTLFYSNSFSMEDRQQAEFRTFRIGQKHPCNYIDYIAAECDEVTVNALHMKKNLLDYIREKDLSEVI